MWGEGSDEGKDLATRTRHWWHRIDVAGGSGSGKAGEGNSLYCDQLTHILLLTTWWEGGWQVEVQLQYNQLFCFCLLHVFVPLALLVFVCTCLLDSVAVLLFTVRSPFWFCNRCQLLLPVPGSVKLDRYSVPGRYRPELGKSPPVLWILRFPVDLFVSFSLPVHCCSRLSVCVFFIIIYV